MAASAAAAGEKAGQKGNGPLRLVKLARSRLPDAVRRCLEDGGDLLLPLLRRLRQCIIDNTQVISRALRRWKLGRPR